MWRSVLYLVSVAEAAVLAALLVTVVIEPGSALTPGMRQVCAVGAVLLGVGCCYAVVRWLRAHGGAEWAAAPGVTT